MKLRQCEFRVSFTKLVSTKRLAQNDDAMKLSTDSQRKLECTMEGSDLGGVTP